MLGEIQEAIRNRPGDTRLLFLSDYDGTLADFHVDPTIPRPSKRTRDLLWRLALREDLSLGIVSGRRIADLRTRTQLPSRVYLAGLHGLEIEIGKRRWHHADLEAARDDVRELSERLEAIRERVPGVLLEDKHVSIAVHVRGVMADRRDEALALADQCAAEWVSGGRLRRLAGNLVLEFLPNAACHKGEATRWIVADVERSCAQKPWTMFVGDDLTDEDAFNAIESGIGVLVGSRATAATFRVSGIPEVNALLAWLAR
jgi:trehalose 6-phosphate phosphatase